MVKILSILGIAKLRGKGVPILSFNWDFVGTVVKVETEPAAEYNFSVQSLSENRIFEQLLPD